jgi:quercetin dioxygenase-like cupin family protein
MKGCRDQRTAPSRNWRHRHETARDKRHVPFPARPGARTAWHTHPAGQTLILTAGLGWVQEWGGRVQEIRSGDVVRIPPGQKHWHGATPTTAMTHIALQDEVDGKVVEWMEKVSDEQYQRKPSAR